MWLLGILQSGKFPSADCNGVEYLPGTVEYDLADNDFAGSNCFCLSTRIVSVWNIGVLTVVVQDVVRLIKL